MGMRVSQGGLRMETLIETQEIRKYRMKNYFRNGVAVTFTCMAAFSVTPTTVTAQEAFFGEMRFFTGDFAPRGWAKCDGQLMQIAQNQSLYSIIGTTYGGDGITTFALPDMRGRIPMHAGHGPNGVITAGDSGGNQSQLKQNTSGGLGVATNATQAVNCIIAIDGLYPSRN